MSTRVDVRWNSSAASRALTQGVIEGLERAGRRIEAASNALAPTLTGQLESSSTVTVDRDRVAISYDDEAAVYQHERLDFRHDDGQAKFLEQAVNAGAAEAFREIAAAIAGHLR